MELLTEILFQISTWALLPVVAALLLLLARALVGLGGLAAEARQRHSEAPLQAPCLAWLEGAGPCPERPEVLRFLAAGRGVGLVGQLARRSRGREMRPEQLPGLADALELEAGARVAGHGLEARIAPMLGLMGTLIPLGPALVGLSAGDLDSLAANLVVAFGTTVVGLGAGALRLSQAHVRRHWYARDLVAIDALIEILGEGPAPSTTGGEEPPA